MKNIKYTDENRKQLFEDLLIRNYSFDDKSNELDAFRNYFNTGEIDRFIEEGGSAVDPFSTFFVGANPTLENLKIRLKAFWDNLIAHPEMHQGSTHMPKELSIEQLFNNWAKSCVSSYYSYFIPSDVQADIFLWIYGEKYQELRHFPMSFGTGAWEPIIHCDADWLTAVLLRRASDYFFDIGDEYYDDPRSIVLLFDYLYSVLRCTSKEIYFKEKFSNKHRRLDGEYSGFSSKQSVIRAFIAKNNGILLEDEAESGNDIVLSDPERLSDFVQNFESSLPYPDLYDELVKFVIASGEEYLWASED